MALIVLYLALEPRNGSGPVTLARVSDREAITHVARAAIAESRNRVSELGAEDEVLGCLQLQECQRLQAALRSVIPELEAAAAQ